MYGTGKTHVIDYLSRGGIEGEEVVVLSVHPKYLEGVMNEGGRERSYSGIEASSSGSIPSTFFLEFCIRCDISNSFLWAYGWTKAANVLLPLVGDVCDAKHLRCDGLERLESAGHCDRGNIREVDGCDI